MYRALYVIAIMEVGRLLPSLQYLHDREEKIMRASGLGLDLDFNRVLQSQTTGYY